MNKNWMDKNDIEFLLYVNEHRDLGFGRMMQIISEHWYSIDPIGALSVGPCYGMFDKKNKKRKSK